ncbi:MAG: hypothetical protein EZS28_018305 [Streblomastix strix]|uniref:Uncharacterized protein n=1 Tax=Streblomastix strix TaxID=222440 RepID=A0A5J4VUW5_9EUKA|nr:MAG: hypothetical protein EZS28_018305 [Streblomastix strix]
MKRQGGFAVQRQAQAGALVKQAGPALALLVGKLAKDNKRVKALVNEESAANWITDRGWQAKGWSVKSEDLDKDINTPNNVIVTNPSGLLDNYYAAGQIAEFLDEKANVDDIYTKEKTQLSDLTNVVTTLIEATGSGNAITDLQFDGNTLTPAKNKSFVDTDSNQSINGQNSFTTTIHSVDITYQDYDNSNVILAGGGVTAIAYIQSNSYTKSEDDALLQLKADKTELIDSYTKTESNSQYVDKTSAQTISRTKSFSKNITAFGFIKSGRINQEVLLANVTTKLFSQFSAGSGSSIEITGTLQINPISQSTGLDDELNEGL